MKICPDCGGALKYIGPTPEENDRIRPGLQCRKCGWGEGWREIHDPPGWLDDEDDGRSSFVILEVD